MQVYRLSVRVQGEDGRKIAIGALLDELATLLCETQSGEKPPYVRVEFTQPSDGAGVLFRSRFAGLVIYVNENLFPGSIEGFSEFFKRFLSQVFRHRLAF